MRRMEADALVGASRDEVWQLYDDIAGTPRWVPSVREILYVSGPARVGTIYRERNRLSTTQWEIVEHRRPTRQVHLAAEGRLERVRILTFEARGSGTWVHQALELRSRLWGPIGWAHELVGALATASWVQATVTAAKRAFEGDPRRPG
jgi:Polyketide cyclase / dehydrase and lipid transport